MSDRGGGWRWVEPTTRLPLRWGGYRTRSAAGLLLIVAGAIALAGGTSATALTVLYPGWIAHFIGWTILPAAGWRRCVAAVTSSVVLVFLLSGPAFFWLLTLSYVMWLLVRHRPAVAYPTVSVVLAGGILIARIIPDDRVWGFGLGFLVMVVSAWTARGVHLAQDRRRALFRRRSAAPPGERSAGPPEGRSVAPPGGRSVAPPGGRSVLGEPTAPPE